MDETMIQFQQGLIEVETEAEHLLLARHQDQMEKLEKHILALNENFGLEDGNHNKINNNNNKQGKRKRRRKRQAFERRKQVMLVETDRLRNGNREALTALRKRARTTKTSVSSPFESIMREIGGPQSRPLVKEVCASCGNHDSNEHTWMMFPGTDVFARIPFHAAHTILETDQDRLDLEAKKLQSYVKDKSLSISEKGALSDKISPGLVSSLVTLTDKRK